MPINYSMSFEIKCNIPSCLAQPKENTYIYSCGHLFCETHGKNAVACCPYCNSSSSHFITNLSQSYISFMKKVSLIGFPPNDIMESAALAIDFWNFQRNIACKQLIHEKERTAQENIEKLLLVQRENEELRAKCESFISKAEVWENRNRNSADELLSLNETPLNFCPPSNKRIEKRLGEDFA